VNFIDIDKREFVSLTTENTPKPRIGHAAVAIDENTMYIFGGYVV
jgi:hypothetical protein